MRYTDKNKRSSFASIPFVSCFFSFTSLGNLVKICHVLLFFCFFAFIASDPPMIDELIGVRHKLACAKRTDIKC